MGGESLLSDIVDAFSYLFSFFFCLLASVGASSTAFAPVASLPSSTLSFSSFFHLDFFR